MYGIRYRWTHPSNKWSYPERGRQRGLNRFSNPFIKLSMLRDAEFINFGEWWGLSTLAVCFVQLKREDILRTFKSRFTKFNAALMHFFRCLAEIRLNRSVTGLTRDITLDAFQMAYSVVKFLKRFCLSTYFHNYKQRFG